MAVVLRLPSQCAHVSIKGGAGRGARPGGLVPARCEIRAGRRMVFRTGNQILSCQDFFYLILFK